MTIKCIGATSAGNCYILDSGESVLIIDPGVRYQDILEGIDYDLSRVAGVLISHAHGDHNKSASKFVVPKFQPKGKDTFSVGSWFVQSFPVKHDVDTVSFLISHPTGNTLYVTDAGEFPYQINGVNFVLLEANYCEEILMNKVLEGKIEPFVRKRIMEAHLSIDQACDFLARTDLSNVRGIMLLHLSNGNSHAGQFKERVERLTGIPTVIADKNLTVCW